MFFFHLFMVMTRGWFILGLTTGTHCGKAMEMDAKASAIASTTCVLLVQREIVNDSHLSQSSLKKHPVSSCHSPTLLGQPCLATLVL